MIPAAKSFAVTRFDDPTPAGKSRASVATGTPLLQLAACDHNGPLPPTQVSIVEGVIRPSSSSRPGKRARRRVAPRRRPRLRIVPKSPDAWGFGLNTDRSPLL